MRPYYDKNGVAVYHGDALSVLRQLTLPELDAVAMDPPYASGAATEATRASRRSGMIRGPLGEDPIMNDAMTTTGLVWLIREVVLAVRKKIRPGGALLCFTDWRQWSTLVGAVETCDLCVNAMVVWDKRSMGMGNGFRKQHELVLSASVGGLDVADRGVADVLAVPEEASPFTESVLSFPRVRGVPHPSPKPVKLMEALLRPTSRPGGTVLDPFAGTGPTLAAAFLLGRKAIGVEAEERYCELAARRLDWVASQTSRGRADKTE